MIQIYNRKEGIHLGVYDIQRDEELYHSGIKGMKWGVRKKVAGVGELSGRITKTKGSSDVTSNGTTTNPPKSKKQEAKASVAREKSWKVAYKRRGQMSDEQLRQSVNRLQLEAQMKTLSSQINVANKTSTQRFIEKARTKALDTLAEQGAQRIVNKALDKALK